MKLKQKITSLLVAAGAITVLGAPLVSTATYAATSCAGVPTSIISCDQSGKGGVQNSGLWGLLMLAINILTAGVGVAALGGIVYGAVLYTTAGGDPGRVKKAITILTDVGIGIVAYALMWSLLNFLVPGGIFHS